MPNVWISVYISPRFYRPGNFVRVVNYTGRLPRVIFQFFIFLWEPWVDLSVFGDWLIVEAVVNQRYWNHGRFTNRYFWDKFRAKQVPPITMNIQALTIKNNYHSRSKVYNNDKSLSIEQHYRCGGGGASSNQIFINKNWIFNSFYKRVRSRILRTRDLHNCDDASIFRARARIKWFVIHSRVNTFEYQVFDFLKNTEWYTLRVVKLGVTKLQSVTTKRQTANGPFACTAWHPSVVLFWKL